MLAGRRLSAWRGVRDASTRRLSARASWPAARARKPSDKKCEFDDNSQNSSSVVPRVAHGVLTTMLRADAARTGRAVPHAYAGARAASWSGAATARWAASVRQCTGQRAGGLRAGGRVAGAILLAALVDAFRAASPDAAHAVAALAPRPSPPHLATGPRTRAEATIARARRYSIACAPAPRGTIRLGQARPGQIRSEQARLGWARLG